MPVRKPHPLGRQPVDVGRRDLAALRVIALHVAVAEVVGKYEYDVWYTPQFSTICRILPGTIDKTGGGSGKN